MIRQIEKEELRKMHDREGLILQGCGEELKEWTEGINQILEQEGILPKGKRLDDVAVFRNERMTNLLFFFGEEKLDIGKLAIWRLQTHFQFGGTWMSDYVNNRLGGFLRENVTEKPNCALIGEDGNIFNLMRIASRTLRENGLDDKAANSLSLYEYFPGVTCSRELGGYVVENGIMEFPEKVWPYLDYPGIGEEYYASHSCAYTGAGLVVRRDEGLALETDQSQGIQMQ